MKFGKSFVLLMLAYGLLAGLPLVAQQKPFTQDQVGNMVRDGFGDDSGAKLIEQRGIDFVPAEDFLQSLKTAGANEAFLAALRIPKPPKPAATAKPLNQVQILALMAGGVPGQRVAMLVTSRGIDFDVKDDFVQQVGQAGGDAQLIAVLKNAKVIKPINETVDPELEARQSEERRHMATGGELSRKGQYALAEVEYRAALKLDPHNADLCVSLMYVLIPQQKWDETIAQGHEALRLDSKNEMAHNNLGVALGNKRDLDGAIAEFREALVLKPDFAQAHANLGAGLGMKGDVDGAIAEYRAALHEDPAYEVAHFNLGVALERKGDKAGALEEYHAAYQLKPSDTGYKENYERLLKHNKK
jgi:tetratricopeptide (TPR) repeat protein